MKPPCSSTWRRQKASQHIEPSESEGGNRWARPSIFAPGQDGLQRVLKRLYGPSSARWSSPRTVYRVLDQRTCFSCSSARRRLSASASKLAASKPRTAAESISGRYTTMSRRAGGQAGGVVEEDGGC